jgi:hypothetical protein
VKEKDDVIFFQALKDLDYDVREKLFVESLLDIEFTEIFDKGILYAGTVPLCLDIPYIRTSR